MNNWIAIDFGTSTVKAAYLDTADGEPRVLELGEPGAETLPSTFYVGEDGISVGNEAEEKAEKDPKGVIDFLKRNFIDRASRMIASLAKGAIKWWRSRGKEKLSDGELETEALAKLFQQIRVSAGERIDIFQGEPPTTVCLTVTPCYHADEEKILREAAKQAGFETVEFVEEPVAAAWEWASSADAQTGDLIVLDCGSGTTDWTHINYHSNTDFEISQTSSGVKRGGSDVDEKLADRMLANLPSRESKRIHRRPLTKFVRTWKEDYCNGSPQNTIFDGVDIQLTPEDLKWAIDQTYIDGDVFEKFKPFVNNLKKELDKEILPILMVGGSHKLKGLEAALTQPPIGCRPIQWEHRKITSVVLGAVRWFESNHATAETVEPPTPEKIVEDLRQSDVVPSLSEETVETPTPETVETPISEPVADSRQLDIAASLSEAATLIGVKEDSEVKLSDGSSVVPGLGLTEPAAALLERAERIKNGGLRLAVIGAMGRVKPALINALLGDKALLPISYATTAVITRIVSGKSERVVLVEKDGDPKRCISREEFAETCAILPPDFTIPEAFANVDYAVLESDLLFGHSELEIVDTPGFSTSGAIEKVTENYLNEVDAVLFVLDESRLFDKDASKFIEKVRRAGPSGLDHVFFVINYGWLTDDEMAKLEKAVEKLLVPEFGEAYKRHVFMVDAENALKLTGEGRSSLNTKEQWAETGIPAFEVALEKFLKSPERVKVILDTALPDILKPAITEAEDRLLQQKSVVAKAEDSRETAVEALSKRREFDQKVKSIVMALTDFGEEFKDSIDFSSVHDSISSIYEPIDENKSPWEDFKISYDHWDYAYLSKKGDKNTRESLARDISWNLTNYFKKNARETILFDAVIPKIRDMSETLRTAVTALSEEMNTGEFPWMRELLDDLPGRCERYVTGTIAESATLSIDSIQEIVDLEMNMNNVFGSVLQSKKLYSRSHRISSRKKDVKGSIRRKLYPRNRLNAYDVRSQIEEGIKEVCKSIAKELEEKLKAEIEQVLKHWRKIRNEKRAEPEKREGRRLEIIHSRLKDIDQEIHQAVYRESAPDHSSTCASEFEDKKQALALYAHGLAFDEISAYFGGKPSERTIRRWVEEADF